MATATQVAKELGKLVLGTDHKTQRVVTMLQEGKKRIRKNWIRGDLAVDKYGNEVKPNSEKAVGWCALGAVGVMNEGKLNAAGRALTVSLPDPQMDTTVEGFNDDGSHTIDDVLNLFDDAITYVKKYGVPTASDLKEWRKEHEVEVD